MLEGAACLCCATSCEWDTWAGERPLMMRRTQQSHCVDCVLQAMGWAPTVVIQQLGADVWQTQTVLFLHIHTQMSSGLMT